MYDPAKTPTEHMVQWLDGYRSAYSITHPGRLTADELKAFHDNLLTEVGNLPEPYALPPGATGLTLYSGRVGPDVYEHSGAVARAMSDATGGRQGYFGDTVAGQVLNDDDVQDALGQVVGNRDSFDVLMSGRGRGADRHVYGDDRLAVWDEVSREFVRANPDLPVTAVVPDAAERSVFVRTEVGAYLDHSRGQPLNGRTQAQWRDVYDQAAVRGMNREQSQHAVAGAAVRECDAAMRGVPVHELAGGRHMVDVGPLVGNPSSAPPGTVRTTTMGERLDALRASRTAGAAPAPPAPAPTRSATPGVAVPSGAPALPAHAVAPLAVDPTRAAATAAVTRASTGLPPLRVAPGAGVPSASRRPSTSPALSHRPVRSGR